MLLRSYPLSLTSLAAILGILIGYIYVSMLLQYAETFLNRITIWKDCKFSNLFLDNFKQSLCM